MAAPIGEAYVLIRPTDTGFEAQVVSQVDKDLAAAAKKIKPLKIPGPDGSAFSKAGSQITSSLQGMLGPLGNVTSSFSSLGSAGAAGGPLGIAAAGVAALGAGLITLGVNGIKQFTELAGQIRQFKNLTGTTAQDASRMVVAFNTLGVSTEGVARGLFRLSRATGDQQDKLAALGVQIAKTDRGSIDVNKTFLAVADAVHNSTDASQRNTIAFEAFGRAGLSLIPVLAKGRSELQSYFHLADERHEVFTDKDLNQARQFQIAQRNLSGEFKSLEIGLGRGLMPIIQFFVGGLTIMIRDIESMGRAVGGFLSHIPGVSSVIKILGNANEDLAKQTGGAGNALDSLNKSADGAAGGIGDVGEAGDAAAGGMGAADEAAKALKASLDQLATSATSDVDLVLNQRTADLNLREAKVALARATKEERDALHGGADAARQHTTAVREQRDADRELVKAKDAVTAAQERLTRALAGPDPRELEKAGLDVRQAQRGVSDAQATLNDVLRRSGPAGEEVTKAQLALTDAQTAAAEATSKYGATAEETIKANIAVADAQAALTDVVRLYGPAGQEAAKAQDDLTRAQWALADAQKEGSTIQENAAKAVTDAQAALTDAQRKVSDLQEKINQGFDRSKASGKTAEEAHLAVARAQDALVRAQAGAIDSQTKLDDLLTNIPSDQAQHVLDVVNGIYRQLGIPIPKEKNGPYRALADIVAASAAVNINVDTLFRAFSLIPGIKVTTAPTTTGSTAITDILARTLSGPAGPAPKSSADVIAGIFGPSLNLPGRAVGGPVYAGAGYVVGERGPELFVPNQGGTVIPGPWAGSGIAVTINATFGPGTNADDVTAAMRDVVRNELAASLDRMRQRMRAS